MQIVFHRDGNPGLLSLRLRREAIEQPASLSDVALISVPDGLDVPENLTQLVYHHDQKTPFDLTYNREWQPVGKTNDHVVFILCPIVFSLEDMDRRGGAFTWEPERGTRLGIMPRSGGNADVRW